MQNFNPMQVIQSIRSGQNPQQIVMNILQQQMGQTPMGKNLINLAMNNRTAELEQVARNLVSQTGVDYDTAFNSFKQQLGIK